MFLTLIHWIVTFEQLKSVLLRNIFVRATSFTGSSLLFSSIILMFCRSVNYSINGYHRQHVVVLAEVVSVALELSSDEVVLRPSPGLLADSGKNIG